MNGQTPPDVQVALIGTCFVLAALAVVLPPSIVLAVFALFHLPSGCVQ